MSRSRMRGRRAAIVLALGLAAAAVAAQPAPQPAASDEAGEQEGAVALFHGIALEPKELDQIEKVLDKDEETLAKARAEIRILQARLARLMLERSVPMDQVQSLVKGSLDWEYQIRMIQIDRQISIRRILGDERWASVLKLQRSVPALEKGKGGAKAPADKKDAERRNRLLRILKRLG